MAVNPTDCRQHLLNTVLNNAPQVSDMLKSRILIVGSGGIGVEIIKNLVLLGFQDLTIIDLDTIDVSNLNRQFLFNRMHIGKSKSMVAVEVSLENFARNKDTISLKPIHQSIMSQEFDLDFFKSFKVVINALDNRSARSHVNRMCLHADVPLIESGSEGYLGQVFLIKKGCSACYECEGPRQDQKTYASCTIRNTPSLPIHCIVWGKHLFAQLYGEEDPDNNVSPDMEDPQLGSGNEINGVNPESKKLPSTREWANANNYDPNMLFNKLFRTDIEYLLKMTQLWENRRRPEPLTIDDLGNEDFVQQTASSSNTSDAATVANGVNDADDKSLKDQVIWSLKECYEKFCYCIKELHKRLSSETYLVWDKDDDVALDFVTCVSNLRSFCFGIERKSRFDVKSMAGNIIPAISSTNSIVGGIITLQLIGLLRKLSSSDDSSAKATNACGDPCSDGHDENEDVNRKCREACRVVYLKKVGLSARNLISSYELFKPNENCLVCSSNIPILELTCSLETVTMSDFVESVLTKALNFICPDVYVEGTTSIIWSKDDSEDYSDEERQEYKKRPIIQYPHIRNTKTRLRIVDLLSSQELFIDLKNEAVDPIENDGHFYKLRILNEGTAKPDKSEESSAKDDEQHTNGSFNKAPCFEIPDDDAEVDFMGVGVSNSVNNKRKLDIDHQETVKKLKVTTSTSMGSEHLSP